MAAPPDIADILAGFPRGWLLDLATPGELLAWKKQQVLVQGATAFQEYEIFISPQWGRVLVLDGRLQSAQADEGIYHEALVHPALTAHPNPQRVMVMGGGEGATLREVLRHACVTRAVMVDLDAQLVEVCRTWLPTFHQGAFDDPRTELVCADGRAWLAAQADAEFDVIILDLTEPLEEGPALALFTREMYELCRRKLAPGGLLAVQSGSAGPAGRLLPDLHATLRAVFPRVEVHTAFIPSFLDLYAFQVAGGEDFDWPDAEEIAARLEARRVRGLAWFAPEFGAALPYVPRHLAARLAGQGRVLTDAAPFAALPGEERVF